jgi:hypothetical protein
MGLGASELAIIDELLRAESESAPGSGASALAGFRERFPRLSLTRCDASDIDSETPFRVYSTLSLFLVDASDHCWRITSDPARATGIVVARHILRSQERS